MIIDIGVLGHTDYGGSMAQGVTHGATEMNWEDSTGWAA